MPLTRRRSSRPEAEREGEGRADFEAENLRQPPAHLRLVAAVQALARDQLRGLEGGVVAAEGDHVRDLAEREGIERAHLPARRGRLHPRQRAHARGR